jgi:hypothetical protein
VCLQFILKIDHFLSSTPGPGQIIFPGLLVLVEAKMNAYGSLLPASPWRERIKVRV